MESSLSDNQKYLVTITLSVEKLKKLVETSNGDLEIVKNGLLEDESIFSCLEESPDKLKPLFEVLEKKYFQDSNDVNSEQIEGFFKSLDPTDKEIVLKFSEYLKYSYLTQDFNSVETTKKVQFIEENESKLKTLV